jgi:hypothetical protein
VRASVASVERQLLSALRTLDAIDAPADIGAYIDLAMHRLRQFGEDSDALKPLRQIGNIGEIAAK